MKVDRVGYFLYSNYYTANVKKRRVQDATIVESLWMVQTSIDACWKMVLEWVV